MSAQILHITVPQEEMWDEVRQEFIYMDGGDLYLHHTLVTVAEWEAKWKVSFLNTDNKTPEQVRDYIRCMTINQNEVSDAIYNRLTEENMDQINAFISDNQSATVITNYKTETSGGSSQGEIVTAELVYYWMFSYNIPVEFENWHFGRLIKLIQTFNAKSDTSKMSKQETAKMYKNLNEMRKAKYKTKG